jgi:hypothetical protein
MIQDIENWKTELLFTGRIIQDDDKTVSSNEAEKRFNRYIELLDMVEGNEGPDVFRAIIDSIQADEDYGAYQSALSITYKFPEPLYTESLIKALPDLIRRQPDWAGTFLVSIANQVEFGNTENIYRFNQYLSRSDNETRRIITNFIREQERVGWLENRVGVLAANNTAH